MTRHQNEMFAGVHFVLDNTVLIECVFTNCSLEYSGGDVYVQNCRGENCEFVWRDAAERTIKLLQGLGLFSPESTILSGSATSRPQ